MHNLFMNFFTTLFHHHSSLPSFTRLGSFLCFRLLLSLLLHILLLLLLSINYLLNLVVLYLHITLNCLDPKSLKKIYK